MHRLANSAGRVAAGDWNATVDVSSADEIGQLARAFNRMTGELVAQRERLVQAERVAAWRELARRLAHELKNPLFPLQITVENMLRARDRSPGTVRRGLPRRHRHAAGGVVPIEADRRPVQRLRQDAGAGNPAGRVQPPGRRDPQAVRRPTGSGAGSLRDRIGSRGPQGACGPRADHPRAAKPGAQRHRRHARGRHAHRPHRCPGRAACASRSPTPARG